MKKFSVVSVIIIGLMIMGCSQKPASSSGGTQAAAPAKKIKIGIASANFSNANQSYLSEGYRYWATQFPDLEINIIDGQDDQTIQSDRIDIMLNQGVDALILNLVNSESAPTIIEKVRSKQIPIVFINKNPSVDALKSYDRCMYVGVDTKNQGLLQGQFMEEAVKSGKWDKNGDGKISYVILLGQPGHTDTPNRYNGFTDYVKSKNLPVVELAQQHGNWATSEAKSVMETWIGKFGDKIEFVVSGNDAMAIGAVEALRAAGMITDSKITPVVGVNALPEASSLIQSGIMLSSILTNPAEQAHAAVECARNSIIIGGTYDKWIQGTKWVYLSEKDIRVPDVVITKDNVQVAIDAYIKAKK